MHIICKTLKESDEKTFPTGFNGIRNTLALYLECQNEKFNSKRQEYKHRNIVTKAVEVLAKEIFNADYERLKVEDAFTVFDANFPGLNSLLADLIEEGILIKHHYRFAEQSFEYLVFSYQRIGDFCIAEEILKPYDTYEKLLKGFASDSNLNKIKSDKWQYDGLFEAMSIILPEKYNHELFELLEFFVDKSNSSLTDFRRNRTYYDFAIILINSLKWRAIDSIDCDKIMEWFYTHNNIISFDKWLNAIIELSTIPNHPFNSDYLHQLLLEYPMPIRDGFWQDYLLRHKDHDDRLFAYPYRRLIDWAWTPGISSMTDTETVRLAAQTLAWGLASTNNTFRDQTTKAMVNLLEQQPKTLILILRAFENVDDPYIIERLYAIAYGCILRTEKDDSITLIARYVFDVIFKKGNPPVHVLLRDYARNIIEYAIYRNLITDVDVRLIRPPYFSSPPVFPDTKEIEEYRIDYDNPEYTETYGSAQNAIYNSLIDGIADFGHYVVESAVDNFSSVSVLEKAKYDSFYGSSNDEIRDLLDNLFEYRSGIIQNKKRKHWTTRIGVNFPSSKIDVLENSLSEYCISELQKLLDKPQFDYLQNSVIPYFDCVAEEKGLDTWSARNWVLKRVFELGYDRTIHGEYDSWITNSYYNNEEDKTERIGKKYEWIAYHELMARISDNYCLSGRWRNDSIECYKGPWQLFLRNIDPVYTKRVVEQKNTDVVYTKKEWWKDDDYLKWNFPDEDWVNTIDDLISPQSVIQKKDEMGSDWLRLSHHAMWKEPKRIGENRYSGKQIWYFVQAFIVDKQDKQDIVTYLSNQNFWGRWLPERHENTYLFSREKYWSPAYKDSVITDDGIWSVIQDTNYNVIIADEEAKGTIDGDKSGSNKSYYIPCAFLFEGMNLRYTPKDGDLKNERGETIVINKDENGCLIRKTALLEFLEKNNLDIIWTILGEKLSTYGTMVGAAYCKVPCGVFYLEDGEIVGKLKMYDRE